MDPPARCKLDWCEGDDGQISIIFTFNSPLLALHTLTERLKLLIMFTEQQEQDHRHFSSWRVQSVLSTDLTGPVYLVIFTVEYTRDQDVQCNLSQY